jgi:hypothetical protein
VEARGVSDAFENYLCSACSVLGIDPGCTRCVALFKSGRSVGPLPWWGVPITDRRSECFRCTPRRNRVREDAMFCERCRDAALPGDVGAGRVVMPRLKSFIEP